MPVEDVYTNAFDASRVAWVETGVSPYLHDTNIDWIGTNIANVEEGDWAFPVSAGSDAINSVKVRLENYVTALGCGLVRVYVWNGAIWSLAGSVGGASLVYAWEEIDVSAILNTWAKINAAKVYLKYARLLNGSQYVRRLTRKVDYTPAAGVVLRRLLVGVGL
ncbi:hypothetical protein MUP01_11950 [Candidatus Bathyarchaeota archaeon]|nr:hypothetical protein [Candidatus Bathyarchaeota archaeon]